MPPEIDETKSKAEPAPLIDFFTFHQGSLLKDGKPGQASAQDSSLLITDVFNMHQGLNSLSRTLASLEKENGAKSKDTAVAAAGKPDNVICVNGICREMTPQEQAQKKAGLPVVPPLSLDKEVPAGEPKPFQAPKDIKPLPRPENEIAKPLEIKKPAEIPPGSAVLGKSVIVEAYERRQGARQAGTGNSPLPPIDAIPGPIIDRSIKPQPGLQPDLPAPKPDLNQNTRPELNPKPDLPPWRPGDQTVKPVDYKTTPNDLIARLEPKYETSDLGTAVKMARETGLPLAVHIGASWCHYCVEMERQTWPGVEGTSRQKGSLQGKVVVLHLDVDEQRNLKGEDARLAAEITKNRGSSVPIIRVFKVDESGNLTKTNENRGAINSKSQLESFLIRGGVKR